MVRSWIVRLVVAGWCLTGGASFAGQEDGFPALHGPYFGQPEPGLQAQRFAPGLVSLPGRYEFALSFSPSGQELLFTQQVPEQSVSVYHSRLRSGAWTRPESVRLSEGAKGEEMEAFFSPDGGRVFFAPYDEGMDVRIWSLVVGPDGWERPRELGSPVVDDPAFYPTVSLNGTLYYTNLAARRVYRAELEGGSVSRVEDAGLEFGGHAFVAPDESFVLVDARAPDSLGGSDIYVAFRRPDGSWARPRHLGAEVNSGFDETCPSLSADGRYLFFSRYDEPDEVSDIYWIDSAVIDAVREEATAVEAFRLLTQLEGRWLGSGGAPRNRAGRDRPRAHRGRRGFGSDGGHGSGRGARAQRLPLGGWRFDAHPLLRRRHPAPAQARSRPRCPRRAALRPRRWIRLQSGQGSPHSLGQAGRAAWGSAGELVDGGEGGEGGDGVPLRPRAGVGRPLISAAVRVFR